VYHPGPPVFHEGQKGRYLGCWSYATFVPFLHSWISTMRHVTAIAATAATVDLESNAQLARLEVLQAPCLDL
jgi:hypothetical protein